MISCTVTVFRQYSSNSSLMYVCVSVAEWNQYDGVAFPKVSKGLGHIVTFGFFDDNGILMIKQTTEAFRCWLPRWIGPCGKEDSNCGAGMVCYSHIIELGDAFLASMMLHQLTDNRQLFIDVCIVAC